MRYMHTIAINLRRKLGDDADNPSYIFNKPCVGYRMEKDETPEPEETWQEWLARNNT